MRRVRVVEGFEAAEKLQRDEWARLTAAERLAIGAELHEFRVRNYYPNADLLDRTVRIVERERR